MKTIITMFALVALAAVVCSLACRSLRGGVPESSPVADEMEQAYGTNWAERLIAAGTTNQEFFVEMARAYYEAVDADAASRTQSPNWAGRRYIRSNERPLSRTPH